MMNNTSKKLKINDLKIGMHVDSEQLSNIFNYYIILSGSSVSDDGTKIIGDIEWFGEEMTTETEKYNNMKNIAIISNSDDTSDGEVYYDE